MNAHAMVLLLLWSGCHTLDDIPIFDGTQCAPDRVETVDCVLDGDTVQVGSCGGESIRLLGINAPEIAHEGNAAECYGSESAAWLTDLLFGQEITLRFDETCQDTYGRTLAYVYLMDPETGDVSLVNEMSVREGQSVVYEDFDDIKLANVLYAAQDVAQRESVGLWGECE